MKTSSTNGQQVTIVNIPPAGFFQIRNPLTNPSVLRPSKRRVTGQNPVRGT